MHKQVVGGVREQTYFNSHVPEGPVAWGENHRLPPSNVVGSGALPDAFEGGWVRVSLCVGCFVS